MVSEMQSYRKMELITHNDYLKFRKTHSNVNIGNVEVELPEINKIKKFAPSDFKPEKTTVWSFPDRGDWATHRGNYRGNWSPYIPRNLILRYSEKDDLVLDQMVGSGTTLVECKLLQRNGIGVDINKEAIMVALNRLNFKYIPLDEDYKEPQIKTYVGDARNLDLIKDDSIDLITIHPPYAGIISYSNNKLDGDLSTLKISEFIEEMKKVAEESYRVLKPGKHLAILIGDTRKHKHYIPINVRVLEAFLKTGFIIREDIIKEQWKMKSTREKWFGSKYDFLLLGHEHLFIFRKAEENEKITKFKDSIYWK